MNRVVVVILLGMLVSCGSTRVITTKDDRYQKPDNSNQTTETGTINKMNQSSQNTNTNTSDSHSSNTSNSNSGKSKVERYIDRYSAIAIHEMKEYGVPASITLAQGILESGAGEGDLTKRANNHFGIKCHGWTGEKVYHDDDEKGECFRKYPDPAESFKDHSLFLVNRKRYAGLFKLRKTDYKGWAKGLKIAGYATDPKYPNKLITLIERYRLDKYDTGNSGGSNEQPQENTAGKSTDVYNQYLVKKGDTLYSISKKVGLTVEELMSLNQLESANISVDQVLKIK